MEWWKEPFFQVAVPLIIAFTVNNHQIGKRLDDFRSEMIRGLDGLGKRIDAVEKRLETIEKTLGSIRDKLENHGDRITRLEAGRWK
jgi:archaellum component FlaC